MKTEFNKSEIIANRGCYTKEQVLACSFIGNGTITLGDIVNSELQFKDRAWFVCKHADIEIRQLVQFSLNCAEAVLFIWENRFPKDERPREAIKAVKDWLNDPVDAVDDAYTAVHDAVHTADAANSAAFHAAFHAADAADSAAAAAFHAADAAAYADAAADLSDNKITNKKLEEELKKIIEE